MLVLSAAQYQGRINTPILPAHLVISLAGCFQIETSVQCSVRPNGPTLQSVKSWQIKPKVSFSPLPGLEEILQKVRIPMPLQNQTSQVGDLTTKTRCPKRIISINTEPFPGLKESKLGILAESKLTPSSGAVSITTDKVAPAVDDKKAPHTFNFAPLH